MSMWVETVKRWTYTEQYDCLSPQASRHHCASPLIRRLYVGKPAKAHALHCRYRNTSNNVGDICLSCVCPVVFCRVLLCSLSCALTFHSVFVFVWVFPYLVVLLDSYGDRGCCTLVYEGTRVTRGDPHGSYCCSLCAR